MIDSNALENVLGAIVKEKYERFVSRRQEATVLNYADRMILFGAGYLGNAILADLVRQGIIPLGYADNDTSKQDTLIGPGKKVRVFSPFQARCIYHDRAASYVISMFNASAVREQLCNSDIDPARIFDFVRLHWALPGQLACMANIDATLPKSLFTSNMERASVREVYFSLADDKSRKELLDQIRLRHTFYNYLPEHEDINDIYFPRDLIQPYAEEVFVDCGAYIGDTITSFRNHDFPFRRIYAFEPDSKNRAVLYDTVNNLGDEVADRTIVMPCVVGNVNGKVPFEGSASPSSHQAGTGHMVDCRRLDSVAWQAIPTFVKMDVEGAELDALKGAEQLIREWHPVLAICTYHKGEHLWQIPNLIKHYYPGYKIYLRRYAEDYWETVAYCIPPGRCVCQ